MSFYMYSGFGIYIKFETKRGSLVFLTGSYDHAFILFSVTGEPLDYKMCKSQV